MFQFLLAPMLDDRTCTLAKPHPYTGEFIWTPLEYARRLLRAGVPTELHVYPGHLPLCG